MAGATGSYAWDKVARAFVKIADKPPFRGTPSLVGMNFSQKIMEGYRRCEARGDRINGRKAGIQKIWNQ